MDGVRFDRLARTLATRAPAAPARPASGPAGRLRRRISRHTVVWEALNGSADGKTTCRRAPAVERDRAAFVDVDDMRRLIVAELN